MPGPADLARIFRESSGRAVATLASCPSHDESVPAAPSVLATAWWDETAGGVMGKLVADITMSLDGFITGPDDAPGRGLGSRGEVLHNWVMGGPWRYDDQARRFAPLDVDRNVLQQAMGSVGAGIIGRRMFDVTGGWGGNPPGGRDARYFVLTHSVPQEWVFPDSPFTFVTDGIKSALEQARAAARDKDVGIGGGANVIQQYLAAGLVDELRLHLAPVLLGAGKRLFDHLGGQRIELEQTGVIESPYATHFYFTVRH